MNSMTGHGRGERTARGARAVVECASLNRRQAEVSVVLPKEFSAFEAPIRDEVLGKISRGKVSVTVSIERESGMVSPRIDHERARAFCEEVRELQRGLSLSGDIPIQTILAAPGVVCADTASPDDVWPLVEGALCLAVDELLAMRASEGAFLKKALATVAGTLRDSLGKIRELAGRVPVRQKELLWKRLRASGLDLSSDDPRLATEIGIFAERSDISEEVARMESHLDQFTGKLDSADPVGRTLEFIVQEMARELNTTGAKANDAEISKIVVDCKAELDKLREQLANIE